MVLDDPRPMPHETLTPEQVCEALARLGVSVAPCGVAVERRDGRWLARLPGERLAWFAADEPSCAALARERRVLRLLAPRVTFAVPRVLLEAPDGGFDVRSVVPGACDPHGVYARVAGDADAAARLGASIGAVLAELHTAVDAAAAADWLPDAPDWPAPRAWIAERLPRVVDDAALVARAAAVMARWEALRTPDEDRVLVHTDIGFHNLALDPETLAVRGVFDWEDACRADRHLDFRHLVLPSDAQPLLDAAIAAYEAAAGRTPSRERIRLHNAAVAVSHLAFRTLDEDLAWTRLAVGRVLR
jgi:Ser/Thr protein kinase RdoA (MazF antagonist)